MERLFKRLKRAGVKRGELYLAWDFTVASAHSLSEPPARHPRRRLPRPRRHQPGRPQGQRRAPKFTLTKITEFTPARERRDPPARGGHGRGACYLDQPGCPAGSRFRLGPNGQPVRTPGNVTDANFICNIPRSVTSATPGRLSLYGHGLFGGAGEVNSISQLQIASEHKVVLCASDWIGMSGGDVPNTISILQDLSAFPSWPTASSRGSSTSSSSGGR